MPSAARARPASAPARYVAALASPQGYHNDCTPVRLPNVLSPPAMELQTPTKHPALRLRGGRRTSCAPSRCWLFGPPTGVAWLPHPAAYPFAPRGFSGSGLAPCFDGLTSPPGFRLAWRKQGYPRRPVRPSGKPCGQNGATGIIRAAGFWPASPSANLSSLYTSQGKPEKPSFRQGCRNPASRDGKLWTADRCPCIHVHETMGWQVT